MGAPSSKPVACQAPKVVVIENHSIRSCDDRLDDKDTVGYSDGRLMSGQERSRFIGKLQKRLGVQSFRNVPLGEMALFFDLFSDAERELSRRDRSPTRALALLYISLNRLKQANLYNPTTHRMVAEAVKRNIEPCIKSAEEIKKNPRPRLKDLWRVLFHFNDTGISLKDLAGANLISPAESVKMERLKKELSRIGLRVGPADARAVLADKRSSNRDKVDAYFALKGVRDTAIEAGINFNRTQIDQIIQRLYSSVPPNSPERAMMRPPIITQYP